MKETPKTWVIGRDGKVSMDFEGIRKELKGLVGEDGNSKLQIPRK